MFRRAKVVSGILLVVILSLGAMHYLRSGKAIAQVPKKRTLLKRTYKDEPIKFTKLLFGTSQQIRFGDSFDAGDDWLSDILFSFQNSSKKTITYIRLEVELFTSQTFDDPVIAVPINIGVDHATFQINPVMSLKPGETGALWRVSPSQVREAVKVVEGAYSGKLQLNLARVSLGRVVFEDNTMWYRGSMHMLDINKPGVWMNLDILQKPDMLEQYKQYILNPSRQNNTPKKISLNGRSPSSFETGGLRKFFSSLNGIGSLNFMSPSSLPDGGCDFGEGALVLINNCPNPPCQALAPLYFQNSCGNYRLVSGNTSRFEFCDQGGQECLDPLKNIQVPRYLPCSQPDNDNDNYASTSGCGGDCCDSDTNVYPNAPPRCDGALNSCGTQDWNCNGTPDPQESDCQSGCPPVYIYWCEFETMGWLDEDCECHWNTPIIVDVAGDGFSLSGLSDGVGFDFKPGGIVEQVSWTSENSDDAFLVLDRNSNGTIDNGAELFGDETPQSSQPLAIRNGFLALAEFDKSVNGGNGDGQIDDKDSIYSKLRLWQDANHNGISESQELVTLNSVGIKVIELKFKTSWRIDQHGNRFRYWSKITSTAESPVGRRVYDVLLLGQR